jgi:hypothetical protein
MVFADIHPESVALALPILSILGGILIAIVAIVIGAHKKELEHKERVLAMEKGLSIPQPPPEEPKPSHVGNRAGGLVMLFLGAALTIALWTVGGPHAGVWGLLPTGIGIGLLISAKMSKDEYERERRERSSPQA